MMDGYWISATHSSSCPIIHSSGMKTRGLEILCVYYTIKQKIMYSTQMNVSHEISIYCPTDTATR